LQHNSVMEKVNKTINRRTSGEWYELLAVEYLQKKGWKILATNLHISSEEIDIVAQDSAGITHLVEVRSKRGIGYGSAVESLTRAKKRSLWKSTMLYMNRSQMTESQLSVDLVAIDDVWGNISVQLFESIELS
jgi:putative endonuclease